MRRLSGPILAALFLCLAMVGAPPIWGQHDSLKETNDEPAAVQTESPPSQEANPATSSTGEGERVVALQASLESDRKRLKELTDASKNQDREFNLATETLSAAIATVSAKQAEIITLKESNNSEGTNTAKAELAALEKSATVARERMQLALESKRTTQEQLRTLETKIALDQAALNKLMGVHQPTPTPEPAATSQTVVSPTTTTESPTADEPQQDATPPAAKQPPPETPISEKVAEVQQQTLHKEAIAEAASRDVAELRERKATLQHDIALEQSALDASRKQQDLLDTAIDTLEVQYSAKFESSAPATELQSLRKRITETQQQLRTTRVSVREHTDQLQTLRNQLLGLQAEESQLVAAAEQSRREVESAKRSEFLITFRENLYVRGPKVLVVVLIMLALLSLSRLVSRRVIHLFSKTGTGRKSEREDRAKTLSSVFDNAARVAILIGGTLTILDIVSIPIAPLLGGAAVMGLAIAFGAQSLIKDYFTGFIVLLENQYKINDVVTIGDMTGTVERITLRITILRSFEGKVHFIPNGQINSVTNHTHGWARAAIDVDVAYHENLDRVVTVLRELTTEMRTDEDWKTAIVADPEIFGVEALGQSAVTIRIGIKVKPAKQWALKRELLRRIKNRFDELGIEIPFPQQTVYHRYEDGQPLLPHDPMTHAAPMHPCADER